jgi:putative peptidoglycan lipid II flippase
MANQDVAAFIGYGSIMRHIRQEEADLEIHQPEPRISTPVHPGKDSLVGTAWKISAAIMISRVLGLAREMVQAKYFGAGYYTDAFYVAYRIPNLLRDLFAEGALSAAFLPTFVRHLTLDGKEAAWLLANRLINALLVVLGSITLVIFFGAKGFVYLQAAGYAAIPGKFELTVQMTRIMAPFLLCISLASIFMGMLNAFRSFFMPAMASSAFNICCILAGIFLSPFMPRWGLDPIIAMAIGALIGGISQFIVMIPSAHTLGFRFRWTLDFSDPGLRHIGSLMLPAILGLSATQINVTVDNQMAAIYGNGPVSWLSYAFRLMQLPIGIFGIAIATVTMTSVSHFAARKEMEKLSRTVDSSLKLAACLTFPATIGLIIFRNEIVQLLFQRDHFLPSDTLRTGQVVFYYALALFSYSAVKILVPTFYALNDTRTPLRMSVITVAVKIVLNFLMRKQLGFLGLALSTAVASWLNYGLLWRHLRRTCNISSTGKDSTAYLRIALASIAMGCIAWLLFQGCAFIIPGNSTFGLGLQLGVAMLGAMASLLPLFRLFRVEKSREVLRMIGSVIGKVR